MPRAKEAGISCRWTTAVLTIVSLAASAGLAHAQENIGATAEAHNQVSRELSGASGPLRTGDNVFRNEVVRTGADSAAKLVFLDSTNLAVGPTSRVTLDEFVYSTQVSAQKVTVNLVKGVFRFSTGALDKKAYEINTPTATIGVRGTVLNIGVAPTSTGVTLIEGSAIVCARGGGHCVVLSQAGQTARARKNASGGVQTGLSSTPVDVGALCTGSLCATVAYASLSTTLATTNGGLGGFPAGALCGH